LFEIRKAMVFSNSAADLLRASVTSTKRTEPFGPAGELEEVRAADLFQSTADRLTDAAEPGCC
jgi:hypothetical protein